MSLGSHRGVGLNADDDDDDDLRWMVVWTMDVSADRSHSVHVKENQRKEGHGSSSREVAAQERGRSTE